MCLTFCGCEEIEKTIWADKISPWSDKTVENSNAQSISEAEKKYTIYVCGAVEKEGYHSVAEGETYLTAIAQAGLLDCSYVTDNANSVVNEKQNAIIVPYLENGVLRDCYDVNWEYYYLRLPREGLSEAVVDKIADYLDIHGKIANKTVLREVLGEEDYANYHYKLFIAEADYEEIH